MSCLKFARCCFHILFNEVIDGAYVFYGWYRFDEKSAYVFSSYLRVHLCFVIKDVLVFQRDQSYGLVYTSQKYIVHMSLQDILKHMCTYVFTDGINNKYMSMIFMYYCCELILVANIQFYAQD